MHLMLKQNALRREDVDDFVTSFHPQNRHERQETWFEANASAHDRYCMRPERREDLCSPRGMSVESRFLCEMIRQCCDMVQFAGTPSSRAMM